MTSHQKTATLSLNALKLHVNVGWDANERVEKQEVEVNILIQFNQLPKACESDDLKDTICYASFIYALHEYLSDKEFRLVEHLAKTMFDFLTPRLPQQSQMQVTLTKHPLIKGLNGGVSFCYGDF